MKKIGLLILLCCVVSCKQEISEPTPIVVEGWIENNLPPVVMLHHAISFDEDRVSIDDFMREKLIVWGKVTLNNNDTTIIMTGQLDTAYMLPYRYSTAYMVGDVAKKYKLEVEYNGQKVFAETTIPSIVPIDSIVIKGYKDDFVNLYVSWTDNKSTEDYYCLFYKFKGHFQYLVCNFGVFNDKLSKNNVMGAYIYKRSTIVGMEDNLFWFTRNDTITLKLAHIDKAGFDFWESFQATNSSNIPIASSTHSRGIRSNITGGYGYWCGMGSCEKQLILSKDTVLRFN